METLHVVQAKPGRDESRQKYVLRPMVAYHDRLTTHHWNTEISEGLRKVCKRGKMWAIRHVLAHEDYEQRVPKPSLDIPMHPHQQEDSPVYSGFPYRKERKLARVKVDKV